MTPAAWKWSSASEYLGHRPVPEWLHTASLTEMIDPAGAADAYRAFLEDRQLEAIARSRTDTEADG